MDGCCFLGTDEGRLSVFGGLVIVMEACKVSPGPCVVFRPCVFLNVHGKGGMFVFLRSPRQQQDAFIDLTEYESIRESDGRAFGAEHATTVCTLNCIRCSTSHLCPPSPALVRKAAHCCFCTRRHLFRLATPVTLSPLCRLCLKSTVTFMLCLDQAPAPPVVTCFF